MEKGGIMRGREVVEKNGYRDKRGVGGEDGVSQVFGCNAHDRQRKSQGGEGTFKCNHFAD